MAKNGNKSMVAVLPPLLSSDEVGNGGCRGIVSDNMKLITFEPCIAPMTTRKGLKAEEEKPTFSLKLDGKTEVFGLEDTRAHGRSGMTRRLNSAGRYENDDYFNMAKVLWLQTFASYRGNSKPIEPICVLSIPIEQYNNNEIPASIKKALIGEHTIVDYEGCELRINIKEKKFLIVPESVGSMYYWAYDETTLESRIIPATEDEDEMRALTTGTTIVVDGGFETFNVSLFNGMKYNRDMSFSIPKSGFGVVVRAIQEQLLLSMRGVDVNWLDVKLREVAGKKPGEKKLVEALPSTMVDITEIYDYEVNNLITRVAQEILTRLPEHPTRMLMTGGTQKHSYPLVKSLMQAEGFTCYQVPNPEKASVIGGLLMLAKQALKAG